jgi:hypothetical protein
MQIKVKNDKVEEITRMLDAQWIPRAMEATHMDALVNRVQERHRLHIIYYGGGVDGMAEK